MSKIIMYGTSISAPCRAVWLAAEALSIELENCDINLANGDHKKEDFLKLNPQHTVPTINDNGFYLWDSHAIICYFSEIYEKVNCLYPKEPRARAIVNRCLYFDTGVLFANLNSICKPIFRNLKTTIYDEEIQLIRKSYAMLNIFLEGSEWLAGDYYTIADMCCVSTVTNLLVFLSVDMYPNIKAWLNRCERQLPGYIKWNKPGSEQFHAAILSKLEDASRFPLK